MRMKYFTFLLGTFLLLSFSIQAQNLVDNAGFETWTGGTPDSWATSGDAITLSQNTTNVQEGTSSCQVIFTSTENQNLKSNTFSVTAGDPFAISVYIYDNDTAGRARLSVLFDGGDNYYGEYSEDMDSWQQISYEGIVPDGATAATFQIRFYDISSGWDGDCEILVDETSYILDDEIKPEPSNYPTEFAAAINGVNAVCTWVDAVGDQLPSKYLVMASSSSEFTAPVDGNPVDDDNDLSDGSGAYNVLYGDETVSFSGLNPGGTYYFTIYPYTNSESDIDYKTDGTAPTAQTTMPDISVLNSEDFEDGTLGSWTEFSVIGDIIWSNYEYNGAHFAVMSGYDGGALDNEDWLISPMLNTAIYHDVEFSFENAFNYSGPDLQVFLSQDYDGNSDPNGYTWIELTDEFTFSGGSFEWVTSGAVDLDLYSYESVYLAFKYTSNTDGAAKWEVDNLLVTGVLSDGINDAEALSFQVYPNPGHGAYQIKNKLGQEYELSVYNIIGEKITNTITSNEDYILDLQDFENGVYLLQIISNNQKKTISLIKQ